MVLLLSPAREEIKLEMWGFNDSHFEPSEGIIWKDERTAYFVQFIQGLNPRYSISKTLDNIIIIIIPSTISLRLE